jgi:two-component system, NarL family, response regulator LiaR
MGKRSKMMSDPIKVMIVDDHLVVRDGLKVFLSIYDDLLVVGEAENGAEALKLCPQVMPDVILMDMVMPKMDGPTTISHIRQNGWPIQIIGLTSFDDRDLVQAAIQAGAVGFLHKDVHADNLAEAIRNAAKGRATLDDAAMQALIQTNHQPDPDYILTPREEEVLRLLVQGKTNNEIGLALQISPATVRLHVSNILAKLDVTNRTEAVSVALQNGLV